MFYAQDVNGIPLSVVIDGANRHDIKLARETLESIIIEKLKATKKNPQRMCLDKGYNYNVIRDLLDEFGFIAHIRSRGEEAQDTKQIDGYQARRWVVERVHSWQNRYRRILVRWEKRADTFLAMLHIACGIIAWRATGLWK